MSVCDAVYHTPWWRLGKKIRQLLSLMILRSIHPTIITGFYMYKLSYKSFISVRFHIFCNFIKNGNEYTHVLARYSKIRLVPYDLARTRGGIYLKNTISSVFTIFKVKKERSTSVVDTDRW